MLLATVGTDVGELTRTNAVMGTPAYMPPEQADGKTKFVGPEEDVWSLGVMLYELLCGTRPFTGTDQWQILAAVMRGTFAAPRKAIPSDLETICLKCLSREPIASSSVREPRAGSSWLRGGTISHDRAVDHLPLTALVPMLQSW